MGKKHKKKSKNSNVNQADNTSTTVQLSATLQEANSVQDVMKDFPAFQIFPRLDQPIYITNYHASNLNQDQKDFIRQLFEVNMKEMYENSTWGYNPMEKEEELFHQDARYLIATNDTNYNVGYVHFRFVEDEGIDVLYIYEIQIIQELQRKGLGKFLMQILHLVGRKYGLKLLVLTVFKSNLSAMRFYKERLGFEIDETSPSVGGDSSQLYEILSKVIDKNYKQ